MSINTPDAHGGPTDEPTNGRNIFNAIVNDLGLSPVPGYGQPITHPIHEVDSYLDEIEPANNEARLFTEKEILERDALLNDEQHRV